MTRPLVIFGAGGFAREVLQVALDLNAHAAAAGSTVPWQPVAFAVDAAYARDEPLHGLPVLAVDAAFARHPDAWAVVAIGSSLHRRRVVRALAHAVGARWATLVHPLAWLGRRVEVGPGSVVCAGCQITTDLAIRAHVHVNIGCTIGHDAVLEDFVTLNPGVNVSGNVTIGEGTEVGTGTILIPHAHVGAWSILGAGSVVTKPLPADVTAVGAPARVVKTRTPGWHEATPA